MANNNALAAHGTIVAWDPAAGGSFTDIAELRDITPPEMMRNMIETSTHNVDFDTFVPGLKRRGQLQMTIGFLATENTHDETSSGLVGAYDSGDIAEFKITFPGGDFWIFSGFVASISLSAPVDGGLDADISIQPTGTMTWTQSGG